MGVGWCPVLSERSERIVLQVECDVEKIFSPFNSYSQDISLENFDDLLSEPV